MVSGEYSLIRLASPDLRDEDLQRVLEVLKSGELVQGKLVHQFERLLSEFTKIPYCTTVSSGTAALHLALLALGVGRGDRVLVPAFTYPATANSVEITGASIELCDVDIHSYVVLANTIERALQANTDNQFKAVIIVHEFGFPVDIKEIAKIIKRFGVFLIEDAACALGTMADEHHPGFYSDVACLSFHPRKAITTGEGGALLTTNVALDTQFRRLRNHGISLDNGFMDFVEAGLNYRLTNFQAALAIGQLERFHAELSMRKNLAAVYFHELSNHPNISLPQYSSGHAWQSFMVILENTDREKIKKLLAEMGVESNLGAQALNCLTYYQNKYHYASSTSPNASKLFNQGLTLPLYGKLTEENIKFVSTQLKNALELKKL